MRKLRNIAIAVLIVGLAVRIQSAGAKPIHLEDLKNQLIEFNVRCTDCHVAGGELEVLTIYGKRISAAGADHTIRGRVRDVEAELSQTASDEEKTLAAARKDVDGDGIDNWIEILARTDPSTAGERNELHERIESVMNCKLCHTSVSRFPIPGEERAPHNAFGDALEKLGEQSRRGRRGARGDGASSKPILPRLRRARASDTDRDRVKDWDEVVLYHRPADADDTPTKAAVRELKERTRARRKDEQAGFGKVHEEQE